MESGVFTQKIGTNSNPKSSFARFIIFFILAETITSFIAGWELKISKSLTL
jgi:hypothetical protein